jgi:localization factor PodJL
VPPDQAAPPAPDTAGPAPDDLTLQVQKTLKQKGYDPGDADGMMGPRTSEAITEFQRDHGLRQTGRIDSSLLQSLDLD